MQSWQRRSNQYPAISVLHGGGAEFVAEHDDVAPGIVGEHAHRVAALHQFPVEAVQAAIVIPGFEAIAVQLQESVVEGGADRMRAMRLRVGMRQG
nr:MAG: hypothetical protein DIU62_13290 [Pseudomonadota bacterium]